MPVSTCPNCDKAVDMDGFYEHSIPTLFYCECRKVFDCEGVFQLKEIPVDLVDLSDLEDQIPVNMDGSSLISRGMFINKSRMKDET
jgi:hypothetical protein